MARAPVTREHDLLINTRVRGMSALARPTHIYKLALIPALESGAIWIVASFAGNSRHTYGANII